MSKNDMLAPIIRALVGVPQDRLGVVLDVVNKIGGSDGDLWRSRFGQVLREGVRTANASGYPTYPVTIDSALSLQEMIAAGRYDWVNDDITPECFPIQRSGTKTTEIALVHRNKTVESQPLIDELDREGYRPATIEELLALGAKYPDLQREYPIVALGSVAEVGGGRCVVCLDRWRDERGLDLLWFGSEWFEICRFAFVRKD